jgi:hypothetical protein
VTVPIPSHAALAMGVSAAGTSDSFKLSGSVGTLASVVTAINGSGSFQCFLDVQDTAGNWWPVVSATAQTTVSTQTGAGQITTATPNATAVGRLRWTISAGTANVILAAVGQ